jgi:hypothetical protein
MCPFFAPGVTTYGFHFVVIIYGFVVIIYGFGCCSNRVDCGWREAIQRLTALRGVWGGFFFNLHPVLNLGQFYS